MFAGERSESSVSRAAGASATPWKKLMAEHGDAKLTELLATIANCPKARKAAKDQGDDSTLTVIRLL
jgi:hypothetical protein